MIWLAVHMWSLLAGAFFIGLGVGWWAWAGRPAQRRSAPDAAPEIGSLDDDAPQETLTSE